MPGNLKVNPSCIFQLLQVMPESENFLIKARRTGRSRSATVKTFLAGIAQSIITGKLLFDTGGTPTIMHRNTIDRMKNPPRDVVLESYVLFFAKKTQLNLVRPKVNYGKRLYGTSHWQRGLLSEFKLLLRILSQARNW